MRSQVLLGLILLGVLGGDRWIQPAVTQPAPAATVTDSGLRLSAQWPVGQDTGLWQTARDRQAMITAIDRSLAWLSTPAAEKAYRDRPANQPDRRWVQRSLQRFRQLLQTSRNAAAFETAIRREFQLWQSPGLDDNQRVDFTAYYEAVYPASLIRTATYRYPLYRRPVDLDRWPQPHLTRRQIEGEDGLLGSRSPLAGTELVWLSDRLSAFLVHVQGSARLQLTNGREFTIGYAGATQHPYRSIGQELVRDGIFSAESLTLGKLIDWFTTNPDRLSDYLPRNDRFVFFKPTAGAAATGSLSQPLTPGRSIATDKTLFPPAALALIKAPLAGDRAGLSYRYVLDQDTGSAIRGYGRVDVFWGTGATAKARAGDVNGPGALYYLLLKR
ncbi:murein transglycosylase A [Synechococcus elongatus]|uniref:murein transglycosylase A n=1 Tax=Synechococcus elongatus TaxID=32046 RepID=UPI0030D176FE